MVLLILAACSGTGKGAVGARLRARYPALKLSVSHTTRSPRPGEVDGVHYHFVDRATFEAVARDGGFLEWAEYAGNLYGTARSTVEAARSVGHDLLFDVEVVGAGNLRKAEPAAVSVFLLPPSWAELERRLRARGTEDEGRIQRRLATGRRELAQAASFDYVVVNDALDAAVDDLAAIYRAAKLRAAGRRRTIEALRAEAG
ncbi:MAG: guanylate kinase [Myxococcales bacterium]|nr:guanylate kinase [Myxococcales bacterium]